MGGLDWWTGLAGLTDFHLKHTEMLHNVTQISLKVPLGMGDIEISLCLLLPD